MNDEQLQPHAYVIAQGTEVRKKLDAFLWAGGPERGEEQLWVENGAERIEEIRAMPGVRLANPTPYEPD